MRIEVQPRVLFIRTFELWGRGQVDPDALTEWWADGDDEDLRWRDGVGYSAACDDEEWNAWWRDEQPPD